MARKYELPSFLNDHGITQDQYERWLRRKAIAHFRGDKKRGKAGALLTGEDYRAKIHAAVIQSGGRDYYTGAILDWKSISLYNNEDSKRHRITYKKKFSLLPTIDHIDPGKNDSFVICSWRTNDAKNDMSHSEFVTLCAEVVEWAKNKAS